MGCLSINVIGLAHSVEISAENKNTPVETTTNRISTLLEAPFQNCNEIATVFNNIHTEVSLTTQNIKTLVNIQVGLICSVGFNRYLYLQVEEGNIILIDGNYIQVLRN